MNPRNLSHGLCKTRLYNIYHNMKQRCYNPKNNNYRYYGGKGVTVCQEWLDGFINFYDWAINNEYSADLTIDRVDSTKSYCPDNCRWVSKKENVIRTTKHLYTSPNRISLCRINKNLSQDELGEIFGVGVLTIRYWEMVKAIFL